MSADSSGARRPTGRRRLRWLIVGALALLLTVSSLVTWKAIERQSPHALGPLPTFAAGTSPGRERALEVLGQPVSGGRWLSGIWAGGGTASASRVEAFGTWRGTPTDAATTYPATATWETLKGSNWHIATFQGFGGVLVYGLPLLPDNDVGALGAVADGQHDDVFRQVAKDLVANGRGASIVRVGWEANGDWFPWNATSSTADDYKAAFRHVVGVLRSEAPSLIIDFDLGCGVSLRGQQDRLDALTLLYPGDDAVDLVGCDTYDWHTTTSTDEASWTRTMRPLDAVGIADVADFARAHSKGMTVPEWGLASPDEGGVGDNVVFIEKMRSFFEQNSDVVVLESYFSEPETSLRNSIWDPVQNERASRRYQELW